MKTVILPATTSSELYWSSNLFESSEEILIEFDFGWNKGPFFINDPAIFHTFTVALDQFSKDVWPRLQHRCKGVVLYRGSLSILSTLVITGGELTPVESATVFGSYLHHLGSFLPEEISTYCFFEDKAHFSRGEEAQLLSQERFLHVHLALEPKQSSQGVLLPQDPYCTSELLNDLTRILEEEPHLRVIPERRLNELWDGLDELIVFKKALTAAGQRQVLGFEAAGGKIRSRGI